MFQQIDIYGQVKGVTVYKSKNGVVNQYPSTIDAEVTLPQITHPSSTIQAMGDTDIPDQTRVNAMVTQISCEPSVIQSELNGYGVQDYVLRWAQQVKRANGNFELVPFTAYISGIPAEDVGATVRVGESTTGTLTVNTLSYKLLCGDKVIREVDKRNGVLKINGIDYRAEINKML